MPEMGSEMRAGRHAQEMRILHDACREARIAAYQARRMTTHALIIATMAVVFAGIALCIATL